MTDTTNLVTTEAVGTVAVITANSLPVNALSSALRQGLADALNMAMADPKSQAIILQCAGKTFFAGADISEFGRKSTTAPTLRDLQAKIEGSPKPVIAAIHGNALGGGLELALACQYRVAERSARLGLPEINLGLIPGAGGTQRLPRLVGLRKAMDMVTSGKPIRGAEALATGLIDGVSEAGEVHAYAPKFAAEILVLGKNAQPVRARSIPDVAASDAKAAVDAFRESQPKRQRDLPAQVAALECLLAASQQPFDDGLEIERKAFGRLLTTPESAAQRYYFFAERKVWKVSGLPEGITADSIRHVGIIGAGTMGGGIAMVFANAGIRVTITDIKQESLDRGLAVIQRNYERSQKGGRFTAEQVAEWMALIQGQVGMQALADCDLVIEAAFERMDVKQSIFGELDKLTRPDAILATNTSALDINVIATATTRPEQVIGLHFFSPANVMKLLEVVRAQKTSDQVLAVSMALARKIEKIAVVVGVCRGFVGNRMLAARRVQAMAMLNEGAMPWDIDRVLTDFGFPMGPFAMSDLAGLDLGWRRENSNPRVLRDRLCELDRRGQKTGAGYYDYDAGRRPTPSPVVEGIVRELAAAHGHPARAIDSQEVLDRCLLPMVNEGARILVEGKALRASDVDLIWVNGYGWPTYRGGPMYWADTIGIANVVEKLKAMAERLGPEYEPCPLLVELATSGGKLSEWGA